MGKKKTLSPKEMMVKKIIDGIQSDTTIGDLPLISLSCRNKLDYQIIRYFSGIPEAFFAYADNYADYLIEKGMNFCSTCLIIDIQLNLIYDSFSDEDKQAALDRAKEDYNIVYLTTEKKKMAFIMEPVNVIFLILKDRGKVTCGLHS